MPRGKKAAHRARFQQPRYGSGASSRETSFVSSPATGASSRRGEHKGLTLQEEARNTERHHSFWESDQKLRHAKVNFVSAGRLDPLRPQPKDPESALAGMTLDSPSGEELEVEVEVEEELEKRNTGTHSTDLVNERNPLYIVDTVGSEPVPTGLPPPQLPLRPPSPTPSNSSEEVILFGGRNSQGEVISRARKPPKIPTDAIDAKIKLVEDRIHEQEELLDEAIRCKGVASKSSRESADSSPGEFDAILPKRGNRRNRRRDRHGPRAGLSKAEEDALVADYIANIEGGGDSLLQNASFNQRELGGSEDGGQDETESSSREPNFPSKAGLDSGWDRSDMCDFDDLSTSDGAIGEVQAIVSKRDRKSGVQYLVVWQGQTVDEARWVPASALTGAAALSCINEFEAEEKLVAEFQDNGEEDSDDSEDTDVDDALEEEDDQDLLQRKIDRMTDEQIARLLAKQEELGMGSDELLLFDDAADADEDEDIPSITARFNPAMLPNRSRTKDRGTKPPRGEFPAATALADAYDGFDVMDFDRPSLKRKPKGRKGKLVVDLSDSELEISMQKTYENDRVKKKERKQEREELRAQGLLGSKNGKPDLKKKYQEGMSIREIKEEIRAFLMGKNTTLALPPMDKANRKIVHEIANAFNLKSKSAGTGTKRFPVLYRTSRTSAYVERTFDALEARLTRRFFPRMDVSGKRYGAGSKHSGRGGGGFSSAGVSYRDGDIVGGSAPELGVDNKGRAMLEKMGWSTGTALGALNNKGILQPVSHVVKTTKAGLG